MSKNYNDMSPFEKGTFNARKRRDRKDADDHYAKDDRGDSKGKFMKFVREPKEEKLFEDIIDNLGKAKPKEKPRYLYNPVTGGLDNVNAEIAKQEKIFGGEDPKTVARSRATIALDHTANKTLNKQVRNGSKKKEDLKLKVNEHGLYTNGNKSVAIRDSFMAHTFNRALGVNDEPEASPKQVGQLAERLERSRQQQGKSTKLKPFVKSFSNGSPKSKRPATRIDIPKFNLDMVLENRYTPDPRTIEAEKRFNGVVKRIKDDKEKLVGLETIIGRKF